MDGLFVYKQFLLFGHDLYTLDGVKRMPVGTWLYFQEYDVDLFQAGERMEVLAQDAAAQAVRDRGQRVWARVEIDDYRILSDGFYTAEYMYIHEVVDGEV